MAIIYTYPVKTTPVGADLILISDSTNNTTKQTTIQSINDLGPQGTVTDVNIDGPTGFDVVKNTTNGVIDFDITLESGLGLPADDPANSVQFNLNNILTGVPGFTFIESSYSGGLDELVLEVGTGGKRGLLNVVGGGNGQPGGVVFFNDQANRGAVGIFGPAGVGGDGYNFRVPLNSPENPSTLADPVFLAVEGSQTGNLFTTSWVSATDIPGLGPAGTGSQIQFAAADPPGSTNFVFAADPGLSVDISDTTKTRLDVGHRINPTGRGEINIHSGARNIGYTQGGVLDLEYAYPTSEPVFGQTQGYAFVGLIGPEYDENLVSGDPQATYDLQGYNIQLPVVTPADNTQTTYNDARLLVVNGATTGADPVHQSKWISPGDLGIGAGGVNRNVQFNNSGTLDGDNSFNYFVDNNGTGFPTGSPKAHELQIGAGGGALPGMLTLFGDDDPQQSQGTSGILRFITSTGTDYATITGPDIQTELNINDGGTGYSESNSPVGTTGGSGTGMQVYITGTDASGTIIGISVAQQGSGYAADDTIRVDGGDGTSEILVVSASQGPANEPAIYDIKLPKYAPLDDKIWFGKTTDPTVSLKEGELTTSDYFKIPLINEAGHIPGGRLELAIGSPNSSTDEPYGSILLNGGDNSDESGVIRLASPVGNKVGITGPQTSPNPVADYTYDFSLPTKSPEQTDSSFNEGVSTVSIRDGGTNFTAGTSRLSTTSSGNGEGCTVEITQVVTDPIAGTTGIVFAVDIIQPGEGYAENDLITIANPTGLPATLQVTDVDGYKNKVLVASSDRAFGPGTDKLYESRWVDANDLGISGGSDLVIEDEGVERAATATTINFTGGGVFADADPNDANKVNVEVLPRRNNGFSPYPIYQGDSGITIPGGGTTCRAYACNAICDVQGGQMEVIKIYGDLKENVKLSVGVYAGEMSDDISTQLVAYGTTTIGAATAGIKLHRLNLTDMNVWVPQAGTPIVVVIEVLSPSSQSNNSYILGSSTSGDASSFFSTNLAFFINSAATNFNANNTVANQPITNLVSYQNKTTTQLRVCHHFDPFAL